MNALVPLALFGWVPVVLVVFALLPKHRAVIAAFLLAWLFLPVVIEPVAGLNWTKMRATCYSILLATVLYDAGRLLTFKPSWWDLPIVVWSFSPFPASLVNGLGVYDGFSQSLDQAITYGLPYFIGRIYLSSFGSLRELAMGIVLGGLAYVPLCLVEIRLSPQLHTWVYGYFPHVFGQTIRFGGFRPVVFMEHGLAVGSWMVSSTLVAFWLWRTGALEQWWGRGKGISLGALVCILAATAVLCKSSGALGLGLIGLACLFTASWSRWRLAVIVLVLVFPTYVYGRVWGGWSGMEVTQMVSNYFDKERSASLAFRLDNENLLIDRAMQSPVFGWGGWNRSRVFDLDGNDLTVTDGLWIIALGDRGIVGLAALALTLLCPAVRLLGLCPPRRWQQPLYAPAAVLAMVLILYAIDALFNAMLNPIFMLIAGGLSGLPLKVCPRSRSREPNGNEKRANVMGARVRLGSADLLVGQTLSASVGEPSASAKVETQHGRRLAGVGTHAVRARLKFPRRNIALEPLTKGVRPLCAKHPSGRSGKGA